jgi:hypothetical protein
METLMRPARRRSPREGLIALPTVKRNGLFDKKHLFFNEKGILLPLG